MYDIDFIDDSLIADCKEQFKSIYGMIPEIIGAAADKTCVIAKCSFPDGDFYFRVTENSVSEAYLSPEEADSERHNPPTIYPNY